MPLIMAVLLIVLATPAVRAVGDGQPGFQEIEESLTCQCGCGLTVHSCNHLACPSAIPLRQEIRAQMALGLDKDGILAHFEEKYGEKILSAPTTRGFNLIAWLAPFVMLGAGGLVVILTLLRWRRGGQGVVPSVPEAVGESVDEAHASAHEKLLDQELKQFDS